MASIKLKGNTSGEITIDVPAVAGANTLTLPASTGNVVTDSATQTLTNKTLTTPNINSAQFATVSGTAPLYAARAWVNFNGTGTVAINESGNVSSITDHTTGEYSINFTTAMPDNEYSGVYSCRNLSGEFHGVSEDGNAVVRSTTAVRIVVWKYDNSVASDSAVVSAAIFR